jgi:glucose-1-phosphatase
MSLLHHIRTIVFDIGNVLIDIDYNVMVAEFAKIAEVDFQQIVAYSHQEKFFDQYEKGLISTAEFRSLLRRYLRPGVADEQIDHAWNSILISYPSQKFELIKRLRSDYQVLALSNINELHAGAIDIAVQQHFGAADMKSFFHQAYYSHEVGLRKPEKEIYELVLSERSLNPAQTLFIDDKLENTEAAAALGIRVHHLADRDSLLGLFA